MLEFLGSGYAVHFRGDAVEEGIAVCAVEIDIEMGSAGQKSELRFSSELIESGLKAMGGSVKIEGIVGAYEKVNLAFEILAYRIPIALKTLYDVVVFAPIPGNVGIDLPRSAVE